MIRNIGKLINIIKSLAIYNGDYMSIWQSRSKRKPTGTTTRSRKTERRELGRESTFTVIGEVSKKKVRCLGTEIIELMRLIIQSFN